MLKENGISVIVPVYNIEQYISECISSILKQLTISDELIIIDDGSTDHSKDICMELTKNCSNAYVISVNNQGQGNARNIGIEHALGDYILFVDGDDYITNDSVKLLRELASRLNLDVLLFDASILNECDGFSVGKNSYDRKNFFLSEIVDGREMFCQLYPEFYSPHVGLMMIRRELLLEKGIKFPVGIIHEDEPFAFQVFMEAKRTYHIIKSFYVRRIRENSTMTLPWREERVIGIVCGITYTVHYILDHQGELFPLSKLMNKLSWYCYIFIEKACELHNVIYFDTNQKLFVDMINSFNDLVKRYVQYSADPFLWLHTGMMANNAFGKIIEKSGIKCHGITSLNEYKDKYRFLITQQLKEIPFQREDVRLGIYGMGTHTTRLLECYEKWVGSISCNYVYIDSNIKDQKKTYHEKPILNIKDAKGKVDCILISSYKFFKTMNYEIDSKLGGEFKRINLYTTNSDQRMF